MLAGMIIYNLSKSFWIGMDNKYIDILLYDSEGKIAENLSWGMGVTSC